MLTGTRSHLSAFATESARSLFLPLLSHAGVLSEIKVWTNTGTILTYEVYRRTNRKMTVF